MKGNQGLEALAALCGGQPAAATDSDKMRVSEIARGQDITSVLSSSGNSLAAPQDALSSSQRPNPMIHQSPLPGLTQQQWQQAVAAASALQNNGVTQASLAQSLLLQGLSSQGLGEYANSAMQQYAFQQYVQAQAKLSAAQQAATAQTLGAFGDANQQALVMALTAGKAQLLQQSRGKFDQASSFALKPVRCLFLLVLGLVEANFSAN